MTMTRRDDEGRVEDRDDEGQVPTDVRGVCCKTRTARAKDRTRRRRRGDDEDREQGPGSSLRGQEVRPLQGQEQGTRTEATTRARRRMKAKKKI